MSTEGLSREGVEARANVTAVFNDSAAMPGNEAAFERALSDYEALIRRDVAREIAEALRHSTDLLVSAAEALPNGSQSLAAPALVEAADFIEREFGSVREGVGS